MEILYGSVVLVTGASSGIGKAIAEKLAMEGYKVYGTSRNQRLEDEDSPVIRSGAKGGFLKILKMDVCSEESVKRAVGHVIEREGTINILINNAGFGIGGAVEDTTAEEAFRQFDTNFFGVLRMCRNVIPVMRAQGKGLIINIGSVAGLISIPFQSMYSASKYAVEAMSEVLRMEVQPFGIKVTLIEPGDTKTGFTKNRQAAQAAEKNTSVYRDRYEKAINAMAVSEMNGPGPDKVVNVVLKVIEMKNPPVRKVVGVSYKLIVFLKRILPSRLVEFVVAKLY
ncbi:MAG: SDR family oxidoreductase [Clostridiales bacterium]|jgi:short-subunit dehydrogenase|nr:SDR family oxidoreductase [Eubacteriales bacterium]MDH7565421.1 SDR family oxidoreductase [Clostridiales bacterium]